mmetsp:Transcript_30234/g.93864  ORF Transcript_30234/g.93864 Transcript_30234/m.93864 type:complete len:230 (-) Transcript_30234:736-1425(-)
MSTSIWDDGSRSVSLWPGSKTLRGEALLEEPSSWAKRSSLCGRSCEARFSDPPVAAVDVLDGGPVMESSHSVWRLASVPTSVVSLPLLQVDLRVFRDLAWKTRTSSRALSGSAVFQGISLHLDKGNSSSSSSPSIQASSSRVMGAGRSAGLMARHRASVDLLASDARHHACPGNSIARSAMRRSSERGTTECVRLWGSRPESMKYMQSPADQTSLLSEGESPNRTSGAA